jgi:hypothetical protein
MSSGRRAIYAVSELNNTLVDINKTFIYAHGATVTSNQIVLPNNVIVIAPCNNESINADLRYDLPKFIYAFQQEKLSQETIAIFMEKIQNLFKNKQPFCYYLDTCPDMKFSVKDNVVNMNIYNNISNSSLSITDIEIANFVNNEVTKFYYNEVTKYLPGTSYMKYIYDTAFLKTTVKTELKIDDILFDKFLEARNLIYKIDITNNNNSSTTLNDLITDRKKEPNKFHIVIVNTCRSGVASLSNVDNTKSLTEQFNQYKINQDSGKHLIDIITDNVKTAIGKKLNDFLISQPQQIGGKKKSKTNKTTQKKSLEKKSEQKKSTQKKSEQKKK